MRTWPGTAYPLGATFDGSGTNFALFSEVAEAVELCLFDEAGAEVRIRCGERDGFVWHVYLPDVGPGQRYGYRVHGPYEPAAGLRCNPAKLLLDPYAKAIDGRIDWHESLFDYRFGDEDSRNDLDSAGHMPKSVVVSPYFDWDTDRPPRRPYNETVIYEAHVRGLTIRHPGIPEQLRGTYAGLAHPVMLEHFRKLGVTAVELMPVHQFVHDSHLVERGLSNFWGYNTIGFLAPHNQYSSAGLERCVQEFKAMVKALHAEGIEVILDVVYNHTAEGNHLGPTLAFRGIDNAAYYRLVEGDPRYYMDYTGTGNSLNVRQPHTLQLIMDSLRYWVNEMHVDGFRFDLAATLAREFYDVDRLSAFFDLVQQDPVVSQVKLIAEPWDVGEGGYQVGGFPPLWSEWNGKYRDTVRDFWRGEPATLAEFAYRFTGSSDLYASSGRRPFASVNFVTAHDGFTLHDLVSYNEKHNAANGEDNRDGESFNRSWNCGVEGPTENLEVTALREQQKRNFLATLLLSQGVPMLLHGDELGRSQGGNNNAYCQDNYISWVDWDGACDFEVLTDFTARLVHLRREHPVFRRRRFFEGRPFRGSGGVDDIAWLTPRGAPMSDEDWETG
ncbi:MAG: glycogen debranching protein GlgX, partial [Mycobacteriales bacterium]